MRPLLILIPLVSILMGCYSHKGKLLSNEESVSELKATNLELKWENIHKEEFENVARNADSIKTETKPDGTTTTTIYGASEKKSKGKKQVKVDSTKTLSQLDNTRTENKTKDEQSGTNLNNLPEETLKETSNNLKWVATVLVIILVIILSYKLIPKKNKQY